MAREKKYGKILCKYDELLPIKSLKLNPKNPNRHSDEQLTYYCKILKTGVRKAVRVSKQSGLVTVGHGHIDASIKNGWTHVPVEFQDYDNPEAEYADMVADNALARQADIDYAMVNIELPELGPDFDVDILGIADFKIDPADRDGNYDEDAPIDPPKNPVSKFGEIYALGNHRLMCGDSSDINHIGRLLDGSSVDMVFTSPPYNVGIKYGEYDDKKTTSEYFDLMTRIVSNCHSVMTNGRLIGWNVGVSPKSKPHHHAILLENCGFNFFRHIVWKKTGAQIPLWHNSKNMPIARYYLPNYNHEMIYMMSKGEVVHGDTTDMPDNVSMDVWDICQFSAGGKGHPAAFPIGLAEAAINVMSSRGETIFEPFGGSGTMMIAAEKLGRKSFTMEMDPSYVDIIIERWRRITGQDATLISG